jgi:SAM-dependent methyltransferase
VLAEDGHEVAAVDVLEDDQDGLGCAVWQRWATGKWFGCVLASAEALPFRPDAFDCVFCFATLRHILDLDRVFREVARVLRSDGVFVAFHESFRGVWTTNRQRTQGGHEFVPIPLRDAADESRPGPERQGPEQVERHLGLTRVSRRVGFCLDRAREAGLHAAVLPIGLADDLSPVLDDPSWAGPASVPSWLDALAAAYMLDADRLHARITEIQAGVPVDLVPTLLAHWTLLGNSAGVLIARKGTDPFNPEPADQTADPEQCRHLDALLLSCSPERFIPIHGICPVEQDADGPYHWVQPEAALLVPAGTSLEVIVRCPLRAWVQHPLRVEVWVEQEESPRLVTALLPGRQVRLRVPIRVSAAPHSSTLVRFHTSCGFFPPPTAPGRTDTRFLALQFRSLRAPDISENAILTGLRSFARAG